MSLTPCCFCSMGNIMLLDCSSIPRVSQNKTIIHSHVWLAAMMRNTGLYPAMGFLHAGPIRSVRSMGSWEKWEVLTCLLHLKPHTECWWFAEVVLSPHTLSFLGHLRKEGETAIFSVDSALFSCTSDGVLFSAFSSKQHPSKYPCYSKRSWSNFGVGRCVSGCAKRKCPGIQAGMDSG